MILLRPFRNACSSRRPIGSRSVMPLIKAPLLESFLLGRRLCSLDRRRSGIFIWLASDEPRRCGHGPWRRREFGPLIQIGRGWNSTSHDQGGVGSGALVGLFTPDSIERLLLLDDQPFED